MVLVVYDSGRGVDGLSSAGCAAVDVLSSVSDPLLVGLDEPRDVLHEGRSGFPYVRLVSYPLDLVMFPRLDVTQFLHYRMTDDVLTCLIQGHVSGTCLTGLAGGAPVRCPVSIADDLADLA